MIIDHYDYGDHYDPGEAPMIAETNEVAFSPESG
jgi:hypothetical protein